MYVKFDKVPGGSKSNKGSCADFMHYMAKEDTKDGNHREWWFSQESLAALSAE
ncbi:MAG: DUF5712 family protein, partial [Prevotellaceae bacterium]|nr:DUF5712 family protein [Prevotellaceae bacterium]